VGGGRAGVNQGPCQHVTVRASGRSLSAHPARLAGALLAIAALSVIAWYLASPLFVRTYVNEALPSPSLVPNTAEAAQTAPTPVAPRVLRSGELGYVDGIHHGTRHVRLVAIGGSSVGPFDAGLP